MYRLIDDTTDDDLFSELMKDDLEFLLEHIRGFKRLNEKIPITNLFIFNNTSCKSRYGLHMRDGIFISNI